MIDYINRHRQAHILTMEDPVEFVHQSQMSLVNQREVGTHTKSFARALKAALREDPDIVLVGELRDRETVHLALETANTGHLVFATLHTNTAASTIDRIVDLFPAEMHGAVRSGLAESLRGVICQTLCKRIGGGRIAALEVLVSTPAINHLIRDGRTFQIAGTMQTGKAVGMQLLNEELAQLVRNKKVDADEALVRSVDKDDLARRIGRPVQHSGAHSV
jgi:twitching motility protein PilT